MNGLGILLAAASLAVLNVPAAPAASAQVVTFESTVEELSSPDPAVRRQALVTLAEAGYPEAAGPIAALLTDPEIALRLDAMAAELHLFLVEPPPARRRVGLIFEQRGRVPAETLFAQGPLAAGAHPVPDAVFTGLLAAMRDADRRVAVDAIYTMGVLAPAGGSAAGWRDAAAAALADAVGHPERAHRLAAVRVIGRVFAVPPGARAEAAAGDAVVQAMNDREREIRVAAIETLGALRHDRGVQALMERFTNGRRGVEADAALAALARIGHPSASPLFIDQLAGGSSARRRVAVEGLARTGPPAVIADIQLRMLRDADRALALAGAFATARLAAGPLDAILSGMLQPQFADQAFGYLVELVGPRHRLLITYARDPDERVRARLADAVALSGDIDALPLVEPLLEDPVPAVAGAAARAVSWLQPRR